MPQIAYPETLEKFWTEQIHEVTGFDEVDTAWQHIGRAVQRLSDGFTSDRPETFSDYFRLPINRVAYGLFFFPQTWQRVHFAADELIQFWKWQSAGEKTDPIQILDLGAGTGAGALSLGHLLRQSGLEAPIQLHLADHSRGGLLEATHAFNRVKTQIFPNTRLTTEVVDLSSGNLVPGDQAPPEYDIILLSFALNEVSRPGVDSVPLMESLLKRLKPRGLLLWVEPAQKITSEALMHLQHQLCLSETCFPWGPHLHGTPCPMLESGGKFWQHEVRNWTPPVTVEKANRQLWRQIHSLKFTWAAVSKVAPPARPAPEESIFRLVSPVASIKGRYIFSALNAAGQRHEFDIQTRNLDRDGKKRLESIQRGAICEIKDALPLKKSNSWRIQSEQDLILLYPV